MKKLKKVLYAENEEDVQIIVKTVVECLGDFELKICSSGKQLLDEVGDYKPDLIMMDIVLSDFDGLAVFNELKKQKELKNIPVLFLTAKVQVHEVNSYIKQGALGVITKPFNPETLCDEIINYWRESQEDILSV